MNKLLVATVLFSALVLSPFASAQTSKGTLAGTITDPGGAVLVGAQVSIKDVTGAEARTVVSGSAGEFRFDAIAPSTYVVTVSAKGFSTKRVESVIVEASVLRTLNVALEVGALDVVISVEATPNQIRTESGELSNVISTQQIRNLPVIGLNPIALALQSPGTVSVSNRDGFTNGVGFSENGLRPRANNFLIDGFDNNDSAISGQALQPANLEAVREVAVLRSSYNPEFGRGGGSVTNVVIVNGTNQFHGALWNRYTGSGISAIPTELHQAGFTSNPRSNENTFGFAIGGPVVKNKLFFFGSSQWDYVRGQEQAANYSLVPTVNGVNTLKALGATLPNANVIVNTLGGFASTNPVSTINVGNRPGCGSPCLIEVGRASRTAAQQNHSYEYDLRGDYNATDKDTVTARFIGTFATLTPDFFANGGAFPTQDTFQGGPARNLGVFWTHVASPTKVNELRFTAQTINFSFGLLGPTAAFSASNPSNIAINGLSGSYGGISATFPQGRGHETYQFQEAYSITARSHNIKIGADITNLNASDQIPINTRGSVGITAGGDCSAIGLTRCTGLANFLDNFTGPAGTAGRQVGSPQVTIPQTVQAYYAQDTWKVTRNLTINGGVRWEYHATPFNALAYPSINAGSVLTDPINTRVAQKSYKNAWGPRLGVAFTPDFAKFLFGERKTVFRAGGGVFYDGFFTNITDNVASSAPNTLGGTLVAPSTGRGSVNPLGQVAGVTAVINPLAGISTIPANFRPSRTYQWNFTMERELPLNVLMSLSYVGTRGTRLFVNTEFNPGVNGVRLNPARGPITVRTNDGDSNYHGLQLDVTRSFKHGFLVRGAYTWSHAIDDISEVFTTSGISSFPQNPFNRKAEYGPSAFDRRQRFALTFIYVSPTFHDVHANAFGVAKYALSNWQFSGTANFQTGAPETITSSLDTGGSRRANGRPSSGNPAAKIDYSEACLESPTCITGVGQQNDDGTFSDYNTGAPGTLSQFRYYVPASGFGNVGRNTFFGPATQTWRLGLQRNIPIPHLEGHQVELRLEADNPWNHSIGGIPAGDINSGTFLNRDVTYTGGRTAYLWIKYRF